MVLDTRRECARLADQLERAFRGGAWHGPALTEILAGVDGTMAAWRPTPEAHALRDLAHHLAYWMRDTAHRLGGPEGPTGSDWPEGQASRVTWAQAVAELDAAHRALQGALLGLEDARLDDTVPGADPTLRALLLGTLQHNAYHAGQMALLRKQAEAALGAKP